MLKWKTALEEEKQERNSYKALLALSLNEPVIDTIRKQMEHGQY